VDCITVLFVEPDVTLRARFEHRLTLETDLLLINRPDFPLNGHDLPKVVECDVLVLDADRTPVLDVRFWAAVHLLLPAAHIIALTDGRNNQVLEAVLAAGLTGLHRPDCEHVVLAQAIHQAAQGIISFDRALVEHAKAGLLQPPTESLIRFGGLTIDTQRHEVTRWSRHIHLTPLEFALLAYLARQQGRAVSLSELLTSVWLAPPDNGGTLAQVHNCIKRLRQKIEPDVRHPRYLLSERGWGYYLQDPTALAAAHLPAEVLPED
jgi:DNA-binding winged helix-turn-helix (wHTH) protein